MGLFVRTVTILNGQSVSAAVFLEHGRLTAVKMPSGWDTADLSFLQSPDNIQAYGDIIDAADVEYRVIAPGVNDYVPLTPDMTAALQGWIKVRSGTNVAPVAQTADRIIQLILEG